MARSLLAATLLGLCFGFDVLDVGAPRTGTQTLSEALQVLGYRTLHSGYERWSRAPVCNYLFQNGSLQDALQVLDGYDAAMDEPFHLIYREVMDAFPQAKFVLTVSDPETWYQSYLDFMVEARQRQLKKVVAAGLKVKRAMSLSTEQTELTELTEQKRGGDVCELVRNFGCEFDNPQQTPEIKRRCLAGYNQHNARVQEVIPPDRLLVFNMSDGWPSLTTFLGKAVPEQPFPYVDKFNDANAEQTEAVAFLQQGVGIHRRAAHQRFEL
eukprot:gb/GFBE01019676.1/.p1 GENE.gb/GFBE01019676.1/~~gb/GFBE01019676.1/.p1  ORF type:complete len:268 (+),score=68.56 gb/GFBE01019676.1/:1-804(+)